MYFVQMFICVVLMVRVVFTHNLDGELAFDQNTTVSNETVTIYNVGVFMGIIDPQKYSLESFEKDQTTFKKLYEEFVLEMDRGLMNYQKWLIMNNFGLLVDTKESIFEKKISERSKRSRRTIKKRFLRLVDRGDILISSRSDSGLVGHAAIMITDYWVLEMKGGRRWKKGIKNNNRQISAEDWYDEHYFETVTVYRCPHSGKANEAALWADRNYFNPYGGQDKEIRVRYRITSDFRSTNPSYSSKLVLQAYYYGTKGVIMRGMPNQGVIAPVSIPRYFVSPYQLERIGSF